MKHRRAFASVFCLFLILCFSNTFAQHWLQLDDGANHYLLIKPAPGQVGNFTFSLPPVHSNQNILSQGISSPTVSNALLWGGNRNGTGSPDPLILNYGQFGTIDPVTLSLLTNNTARITIDAAGVMTVLSNGDSIILNIKPDGTTNVNNPSTGKSSLNINPNSGKTMINDKNGNPIFTVDQNQYNTTINEGDAGKFTIKSTGGDYAAKITTAGPQGLEVHCTQESGHGLSSSTTFVGFFDGSGSNGKLRGTIQGQDNTDLQNDPIFITNTVLFSINTATLVLYSIAAVLAIPAAADPLNPFAGLAAEASAFAGIEQCAATIAAYATATGLQKTNLGVSYSSSGADYAEYLKRANPNDKLYPGDIIGVKNGLISKNTEGAESIYSISLAPIVLGNIPPKGEEKQYNKVGFLGQVPVKVRGIVHGGDFIITSGLNDGIGIAVAPKDLKPDELPRFVGRAWSSSNLEWVKYINVAVGLNTKTIGEIMANEQSEIEALRTQVGKSASETAVLRSKLERLENIISKSDILNVRSN